VVVTTALPSALLAARLARLPVVVYAAEVYDPPEAGRAKRILGRALCRFTGRRAAVVANSSRVASQFPAARRLTIISPSTPEELADGDPKRFRAEPVLAAAEPLLVAVGNLTYGRGQDVLIRALALVRRTLPNARCAIAGEPHPRTRDRAFADSLRTLVEELKLGDAVVFAGFVDRTADLYAAADIVVNPARFPEPFGRVALEALVAGKPFIGSKVGAIPEVISDGVDGLLVEPGDPAQLADAIVRLWQDGELRKRLVAQGRSHVRERFDEARATAAFIDFVNEAIATARK
jgi:glycosyltransferase involved in cell wall biosynthesis